MSIKVLAPLFPRNFTATERGSFLLQEFQSGREISRREREETESQNRVTFGINNLAMTCYKVFSNGSEFINANLMSPLAPSKDYL